MEAKTLIDVLRREVDGWRLAQRNGDPRGHTAIAILGDLARNLEDACAKDAKPAKVASVAPASPSRKACADALLHALEKAAKEGDAHSACSFSSALSTLCSIHALP